MRGEGGLKRANGARSRRSRHCSRPTQPCGRFQPPAPRDAPVVHSSDVRNQSVFLAKTESGNEKQASELQTPKPCVFGRVNLSKAGVLLRKRHWGPSGAGFVLGVRPLKFSEIQHFTSTKCCTKRLQLIRSLHRVGPATNGFILDGSDAGDTDNRPNRPLGALCCVPAGGRGGSRDWRVN